MNIFDENTLYILTRTTDMSKGQNCWQAASPLDYFCSKGRGNQKKTILLGGGWLPTNSTLVHYFQFFLGYNNNLMSDATKKKWTKKKKFFFFWPSIYLLPASSSLFRPPTCATDHWYFSYSSTSSKNVKLDFCFYFCVLVSLLVILLFLMIWVDALYLIKEMIRIRRKGSTWFEYGLLYCPYKKKW